jgi:nucleoporin NDC1
MLTTSAVFWTWFPFGPAGIRTLLLFTSVLCVFILRIAQLRVGPRTTTSQFNTFLQYILNTPFQVVNTVVWYCLSACIFSEVYIWSASPETKLSMVDEGKSYERSKLNERPLYLRSVFVFFGVAQAVWHLYKDYDRVSFPSSPSELGAAQQGQGIKAILSKRIEDISSTGTKLIARLLTSIVGSSIVYGLFLRQSIWSWTFMFASTWHSLPKNSRYGSFTSIVLSLLWTSVVNGALLLLTWESANLAFDTYVAQAPLKNGSVLTDSSTDPNHSLVAGLKAKKEVTRVSHIPHLAVILQLKPDRTSRSGNCSLSPRIWKVDDDSSSATSTDLVDQSGRDFSQSVWVKSTL